MNGTQPFNPFKYPNLVDHFDFSNKNTLQIDSNNKTYKVSSCARRNALRSWMRTKAPVFTARAMGNRPGLLFRGPDYSRFVRKISFTGEYTTLIVLRAVEILPLRGYFLNNKTKDYVLQGTKSSALYVKGSDTDSLDNHTIDFITPNVNKLLVVRRFGNGTVGYFDGSTNQPLFNGSVQNGLVEITHLGGIDKLDLAGWRGAIGEIAFWERALTDEELKEIKSDLTKKWEL